MTKVSDSVELRPDERERLDALLNGLADAYELEGRLGGDQAVAALRSATRKAYRRRPGASNAATVLEAACSLGNALPLAQQVLQCSSLLDWECWEGTGLSADISSNLHTTELVGPDGHFNADSVRIGLLVSDADTDYPISSHSGEETYLVLAGEAAWTVGEAGYAPHLPGAFVHHPAWVKHGRRTGDKPFLGAWRWSGDLDLSSFSVTD